MAAIEVNGLCKAFRTYKKQPGIAGAVKGLFHRQYEQTLAVNDVSFKIEPGELVGFLGPNGAGKTTTLKMLAGLLYPTSGAATVLGHTPWDRHDDYRRQFALLLGQKNQLWWDLPARESLELNAKIYGIPEDQFKRTVDELTIAIFTATCSLAAERGSGWAKACLRAPPHSSHVAAARPGADTDWGTAVG